MDNSEKVRENRLRRMANRQGLNLVKCKARDPRAVGYGQFFIADRFTNVVVAGGHTQGGYDMTTDDVERYLTEDSK